MSEIQQQLQQTVAEAAAIVNQLGMDTPDLLRHDRVDPTLNHHLQIASSYLNVPEGILTVGIFAQAYASQRF
jgi:hypothetical protein